MFKTLVTAFLSIFLISISHAAKAKVEQYSLLTKTLAKYRSAGLVEANIEKVLKSELTGTQTKYSGKIFLGSGLFRLEQNIPEKTVLVFDGVYLWNEQAAPVDFPGPSQVTKLKIEGKDKSQILFASLLTKEPLNKHFKIISEKKSDKDTTYIAEPIKTELPITKLTLKIENESKKVSEISYVDDVENKTKMIFSNTQFKKSNSKIFKYNLPKSAQLTEIKSTGGK